MLCVRSRLGEDIDERSHQRKFLIAVVISMTAYVTFLLITDLTLNNAVMYLNC